MSFDISQLANYGVLGLVLAWFMLRLEKKMDRLAEAIERLANLVSKT